MKTSIFFIILLLMMVSNTIYPFLPEELQKKNAIKFFAVLAAVIVLVWGAVQIAQDYNSKIYAHVSINGEILKSKNFPWKIEFSEKEKEGEILYVLEKRYGDASHVSIKLDKVTPKYEIYSAIGGIAIKFFCKKHELSNFWIHIKNP